MNASRKTATNWLSAIGYRLILGILVVVFAVTAFAAPYRTSKDGGVVLDQATSLVWARCSVGQTWNKNTCTGVAANLTFDQATLAAKQLNAQGGLAGFNDWVVPTIRQLATLRMCLLGFQSETMDMQDGAPRVSFRCIGSTLSSKIDTNIFPTTESVFLSSSPYSGNPDSAWGVDFDYGSMVSYRRNLSYVRLVRASQLLGGEAALDFPVQLSGINKTKQGENEAREEAKREALERRNQVARDEQERRDAPARQARQMCEAQKQTCVASCPRFVDGRGVRFDFPETPCRNRCESVSCY